jgi:hypothetical protein
MPVTVNIDQAALRRRLRSPGGTGDRYLTALANRTAARARHLAPGSMSQQITVTSTRETGRGIARDVVSNHPASVWVIRGTRPHLIRPRRRKALRWYGSGGPVFAKLVRHPGTAARNFLLDALRQVL